MWNIQCTIFAVIKVTLSRFRRQMEMYSHSHDKAAFTLSLWETESSVSRRLIVSQNPVSNPDLRLPIL